MSLMDADLRRRYDSAADDVYGEFFSKALGQSTQYCRVGGRFTSRSLAACAEGLQEFILADGTMKLVLVPEFTDDDIESINRGTRDPASVLSEGWIRDLSEVRERFVEDHVRALAWMLASGNLEIRVALPVSGDGSVLQAAGSSILRQCAGVFWDRDRNAVSFSGTVDLDDRVLGEHCRLDVCRGWDPDEKGFVDRDYEEFRRYWDGGEEGPVRTAVIPLPDAVRDSLIRMAPGSKSDVLRRNLPRLRPYQKDAVRLWADDRGGRGILEMATGTGKTITAMGCIDEVRRREGKALVVVACPYDNLVRQWKAALGQWGVETLATPGNAKWHQRMKDGISEIRTSGGGGVLAVATTYRTFSSDRFVDAVRACGLPAMLVADEMHNAGSPSYAAGMDEAYGYRLGLSATPERYFDSEGTETLRKFFGGTAYSLDIEQAIGRGLLVGYNYRPMHADLNAEEMDGYARLTRTVALLWESKKREDRERLERVLFKRSRIVRDAASKMDRFREWVEANRDGMGYAIVYCSEAQMPEAKRILDGAGIVNREITDKNPPDPRDRVEILRRFGEGAYRVIVANRILDEGADVPAARTCFMLASTGNPLQFIQRRGRVLRRFPQGYRDGSQKDHADIYDVVVVPGLPPSYTEDEIRIERTIVDKQMRRQREMAGAALNRDECMAAIDDMSRRFLLPPP